TPASLRHLHSFPTRRSSDLQQSLQPMFIGNRFIVAPDASLIPNDSDRLSLVVPQEQAFGTGSHETTSLCIELLESIDLRGKRWRSEEHTSELQSRSDLVCRL